MAVIFFISVRLLAWKKKTPLPLDGSFCFILKSFIQTCCENSSAVKIVQTCQVFYIIFEICAICKIRTEYASQSEDKQYSIIMLV
jgi:hypothetical protein